MEDLPPLTIQPNQTVKIDCMGDSFDYHSRHGNLSMGYGSILEYRHCDLLQYDFPDDGGVYGSLHRIHDSWVGMRSCQVSSQLCRLQLMSCKA
jgi:hypothetical protein